MAKTRQIGNLTQIAKALDVGRQTIGNWALRMEDFPAPIVAPGVKVKRAGKKYAELTFTQMEGVRDVSLYDLEEIRQWAKSKSSLRVFTREEGSAPVPNARRGSKAGEETTAAPKKAKAAAAPKATAKKGKKKKSATSSAQPLKAVKKGGKKKGKKAAA